MSMSRHPRTLIDILRRREGEVGQTAILADTPVVVSGVPGGTSSSGGPPVPAQAIEERAGDPVGADLYAGRVWDIAGQPYIYSGAAKRFVRVGAGALILPAELDRTGSVAGQVIRSTGAGTAPAWAKVGAADLDPTGSAAGQVPTSTGAATAPTWQTPAASAGAGAFAGCKVYSSVPTALAHATFTVLPFNSERWDTDAYHDTGANTSRITIPAGRAGKYIVGMTLRVASALGGTILFAGQIRKNGLYLSGYQSFHPSGYAGYDCIQVLATLDLAVGDYVEFLVYHENGAGITSAASTATDETGCEAWATLMTPVVGGIAQRNFIDPTTYAWSWVNQGGASVAANLPGTIFLSAPANAADDIHLRVKAVPAKPYSVIVHMEPALFGINYTACGVGWLESATNKFATFVNIYNGVHAMNVSKSLTNFFLTLDYFAAIAREASWLWVKLTDDVTNRRVYVSRNGYDWLLFHSVATNDAITPDRLCFWVNPRNATYPAGITIDSWEEGP